MSYEMTLEKAGAKVFAYKTFGDYQGTWLAFVKYNGNKGIIEGSYGSCSGCDSFQAEFDYESTEIIKQEDGKYYKGNYNWNDEITKEQVIEENKLLEKRFCDFGKNYLNDIQDQQMIQTRLDVLNKEKEEDEDMWFDNEKKEYLEWALEQFKLFENE
jgi:hypothetical protein